MPMKRNGRMPPLEGAVFGIVRTPKCSACGTEMTPASATEWACSNDACPQKDKPVHTGVYPVR